VPRRAEGAGGEGQKPPFRGCRVLRAGAVRRSASRERALPPGLAAAQLPGIAGLCPAEESPQFGGVPGSAVPPGTGAAPAGLGGWDAAGGPFCRTPRTVAGRSSSWLPFKQRWLTQTPLSFQSSEHPETPENPLVQPDSSPRWLGL